LREGDDSNSVECWGIAYRIPKHYWDSHLESLDHREKNGYERRVVKISFWEFKQVNLNTLMRKTFHSSETKAIIYYASIENIYYHELSEQGLTDTAGLLFRNSGPSGRNLEYFAKVYLFEYLMNNLSRQTEDLFQIIHQLHQKLEIEEESEAKQPRPLDLALGPTVHSKFRFQCAS